MCNLATQGQKSHTRARALSPKWERERGARRGIRKPLLVPPLGSTPSLTSHWTILFGPGEEKIWVAEATEQVAGRQLRAEADQRRSSPDKSLPREEVAERRGTSANRSLSEEVAHFFPTHKQFLYVLPFL